MNLYAYIAALNHLPIRYRAKQLADTHIARVGDTLVVAHHELEPMQWLPKHGVWKKLDINEKSA